VPLSRPVQISNLIVQHIRVWLPCIARKSPRSLPDSRRKFFFVSPHWQSANAGEPLDTWLIEHPIHIITGDQIARLPTQSSISADAPRVGDNRTRQASAETGFSSRRSIRVESHSKPNRHYWNAVHDVSTTLRNRPKARCGQLQT
jgi:hypothetical protein